jgi:hypothetical protein
MRRVFPIVASRRRKLVVLGLALVGALAVAGFAYSTGGPNAQLANQDRLYGGGGTDPGCFVPDIGFCRPIPTNFSVDAHAAGNGQAAFGDMVIGTIHVQITCLSVVGSKAAVGGIVVGAPDPAQIGSLQLMFLVDGGAPGSGLDLTSPRYVGPAGPAGGWPPGFPYSCPSPDGVPALGFFASYLPIVRGDVVVQDGGR